MSRTIFNYFHYFLQFVTFVTLGCGWSWYAIYCYILAYWYIPITWLLLSLVGCSVALWSISAIKYIAQALAFGRCIYIRLFIIVAYIAFNRLAFSRPCFHAWSFCSLPVQSVPCYIGISVMVQCALFN
jgi:hypothetical protein